MDAASHDAPLLVLFKVDRVVVQQVMHVRRQVTPEEVPGTDVKYARLEVSRQVLREFDRLVLLLVERPDLDLVNARHRWFSQRIGQGADVLDVEIHGVLTQRRNELGAQPQQLRSRRRDLHLASVVVRVLRSFFLAFRCMQSGV